MRPLPLLFLALLVGGCTSQPTDPSGASEDPPIDAPRFVLQCPDGSAYGPSCAGRVEDQAAQLSEPALALMPGAPGTMVLAAHAIGATTLLPTPAPVQGRLYVTEDDGASWRTATIPFPADAPPGAGFSDPAVAFDAAGRLYASGMLTRLNGPADIFVAVSEDLGRTWSPASRLATDLVGNDRNWNVVTPDGTTFVSWQQVFSATWVAWSRDGGATWERLESPIEECYTGGPVAQVGEEHWIGCYVADDVIHLHALDLDARSARPLGRVPGMTCIAPRILAGEDGSVIVTCYGAFASRSTDGGATWGKAVYVPDLASIEDDWGNVQMYWSALDPSGALHVLLSPFHRPAPEEHLQGSEHPAAHVVLDPSSWEVMAETRLTREGPEATSGAPIAVVPSVGDDWWGMEFTGGEGRLVWMYGGALEWAALRRE